ncbi:uncharacterized protein PRCAT00005985001 [Priceomyces carsonii]|uniref:uncharacterized protein n=1 Tax=Priceomyces carsonii TaxID=28549 RepID=UPI002EDAB331|nr:unnamed protein product [Priceomyces carsonii]
MDLVGEIVERDSSEAIPPSPINLADSQKADEFKKRRASKWKRGQSKSRRDNSIQPSETLSEADKIHKENLDRISNMTDEELTEEKRELVERLNPKLLQSLLKRTEKRVEESKGNGHVHSEGYEGWIGTARTKEGLLDLSKLDKEDVDKALGLSQSQLNEHIEGKNDLKSNKSVKFNDVATIHYEDKSSGTSSDEWEDVKEINTVAADDYQLNLDSPEDDSTVHFLKPSSKQAREDQDLDLNDPEFYDKLHEKYYPDLPKETLKLSWMTEPMPKLINNTYDSVSDIRFDFKGDMIELIDPSSESKKEIPTYVGLHHHSDAPHLAGYTLSELAHLSRSVVASQRCVSIQTVGRILHKLGLHKYNILPVSEDDQTFGENIKEFNTEFEKMMWRLVYDLRIIESITEAADDKKSTNISVRNYAVEALWLWKQGGGQPDEQTEEEHIISDLT